MGAFTQRHVAARHIVFGRAQPERIGEVDRIAVGEAIEVEAAGEAEGIFLRKSPDRTCVVGPERRRCGPLLCLAAGVSPRLVVKRGVDPDACFRGEWSSAASGPLCSFSG